MESAVVLKVLKNVINDRYCSTLIGSSEQILVSWEPQSNANADRCKEIKKSLEIDPTYKVQKNDWQVHVRRQEAWSPAKKDDVFCKQPRTSHNAQQRISKRYFLHPSNLPH